MCIRDSHHGEVIGLACQLGAQPIDHDGHDTAAVKRARRRRSWPDLITLPDPRERARPLLSEAKIEAARQEGRRMSLEQVIAYARSAPESKP